NVCAGAAPAGEAPAHTLREMIFEMIEQEIEQVVSFHTNAEDQESWNVQEIYETVLTIFPVSETEKAQLLAFSKPSPDKLEAVAERTQIIEFLMSLAQAKYESELVKKAPHRAVI